MPTESFTVVVTGQPALTVAVDVEQVGGATPPAFVATLRGLSPGDDAPIDSYATDLDTYVATIDEAQDLLDAAQAVGNVDAAIAKLAATDPDFVTTLRTLSPGDDAPLDTYATALAGYVADVGEAQDLLDASIAAGDVATAISILAGGGGAVPTYASLADVIADIGTGLGERDPWRVAWTGDAYIPDGAVVGTVVDGEPSWEGTIPWPVLGLSASTLTTVSGGTVGADGAGRPLISVTSTAGSTVEIDLGLELRTPRRLVIEGVFTASATPTSSGSSVLAAQAMRVDDNSRRAWAYTIYQAGVWSGGLYQTSSGVLEAALGNSTTPGQFSGGRPLRQELVWGGEQRFASPVWGVTVSTDVGSVAVPSSATWVGADGDFSGGQRWRMVQRIFGTGTAASFLVTGAAFSAPA